MKNYFVPILFLLSFVVYVGCSDNETPDNLKGELSEEYYTGGLLGTSFNSSPFAYEQPTPVVEQSENFLLGFKYGEAFFENDFLSNTSGLRHGLGPVYVRSSCIACHPGYGHSRRVERYNANEQGNGYLLVVYDRDTDTYVPELTGMPQTRAVAPFLPPIDERGIRIEWKNYTDEYGNTFPDGEAYSLIYPEVTIDPAYINTDPKPRNYEVRLEATIGIYGTGLIDAIPDDSIVAEYNKQKAKDIRLNDAKYQPENFIREVDGTSHPGRYTYALSRGTLQNGPGSNAIWNITNVIRPGRHYHYITRAYAGAMSKNPDIQAALSKSEQEIYDYLMSQDLPDELSEQEYVDLMVWHRGLAVPAARNLDNPVVQQGRKLFYEMGCTNCHRPSWTTGADNYSGDPILQDKLPRYPNQKIWPYSDFLQHRLDMVNNIRTGWCRTTPLWGRGLSLKCTGASDHLHDMRARNYTEAIMWHGGDAKFTKEKYRKLSKADRDAVIKFLEAI